MYGASIAQCDKFQLMKASAAQALDLPIPERIQLGAEIWDRIAEDPGKIELSSETRKLLSKRLKAFRLNPKLGSPWIDVRNRIDSE